jgi:hypothetical protein
MAAVVLAPNGIQVAINLGGKKGEEHIDSSIAMDPTL